MSVASDHKPAPSVLLAEHDEAQGQALETALQSWGHDVIRCADGMQAWELCAGPTPPGFLLADWNLPETDGVQLCRRLRAQRLAPYAILIADFDQEHPPFAALQAGADDCLRKPVHLPDLRIRLEIGRRVLALRNELATAEETVRQRSTKDALTGLWNRTALRERLNQELVRGQREGVPTGLVLADLDHFKTVNDLHGMEAGDAALREVADRLRRSLRPYDIIGRYGGDEFLILLPGCDATAAGALAERLRNVCAASPVKAGAAAVAVTISAGAAAACRLDEWRLPDPLVRAVETALAQAKAAGANRVQVAARGATVNVTV
jgi:diguanylate cyclase (GGDEF)-like protein